VKEESMPAKLSPRLVAHRHYLASLNDQIERPFLIPLLSTYFDPGGAAGTPATSSFKISSKYEFFCYGVSGSMEVIPSAMPANFVEDLEVSLPDSLQFQVYSTPGEKRLFGGQINTPMTFSQIIPTYKRGKEPFKLPGIWRVPAGGTIWVDWQALANPQWALGEEPEGHHFGITLIGEYIDQGVLLKYGSAALGR
jgi:hypothetical protein